MIRLEKVTKYYHASERNKVVAMNNLSLELGDSGMTFIVGRSGCGKTTLLNILGALDNADSGEIHVNFSGEEYDLTSLSTQQLVEYRNLQIGFVFQDYNLISNWTVYQNLEIALLQQEGYSSEQISSKINDVLEYVGLSGYEHRRADELSGGQMQRIAIARAIIKNPSCILADEPTGNLDSESCKSILDLLKKISQDKLVIIVSHDMDDAERYADRIVTISDGKVVNDKIVPSPRNNNSSDNCARVPKRLRKFVLSGYAFQNISGAKLRTVISILSLVVIITATASLLTYSTADIGASVLKYINQKRDGHLVFYHSSDYDTDDAYVSSELTYSDKAITELSEIFGEQNLIEFAGDITVKKDIDSGDFVDCRIIFDRFDDTKLLLGNFPEKENEICVSDFVAGELYNTTDCIGQTIYLDEGIQCIICGVYDTDYESYNYYAKIYDKRYEYQAYQRAENDYWCVIADKGITNFIAKQINTLMLESADPLAISNQGYINSDNTGYSSVSSIIDSCELVYGRMPTEDNEILITSDYAERNYYYRDGNILSENLLGFVDLYDEKYDDVYFSRLNMYDIIPDVEIVGILNSDIGQYDAQIYVTESCWGNIREAYAESFVDGFYVDAQTFDNSSLRRKLNDVYDSGFAVENNPQIFKIESFYAQRDEKQLQFLLISGVVLMLIILLNVIINSYGISDSRREIGILLSIGVDIKDIRVIYLVKSLFINLSALILSIANSVWVVRIINKSSQFHSSGEKIALLCNNPLCLSVVSLFVCLIAALVVVMPMQMLREMKAIDVLKKH